MHTCVVGQSKLFRAALTLLLEDTAFTVATGGDSLDDVSRMNGPFRQDQVVFLVQKPDNRSELSGQIEMLKARVVPPWIVFMARTFDANEIADSFSCGIDGYLLEEISPQALVKSLNLIALGEKVFPSQLVALIVASGWGNRHSKYTVAYDGLLSDREAEVVKWLMRGAPNKAIARQMSITEATVKVHIKAILKKVGVQNRTQVAIWAVQEGLHGEIAAYPAMINDQPIGVPAECPQSKN